MTTIRIALLALASLALAACGSTRVMESWESNTLTPEAPRQVVVLVVWPDRQQRQAIERDMAARIRAAGASAVESTTVPGMQGQLTPATVEAALRNTGTDGLVLVYLIGGGGGDNYELADYWTQNLGTGMTGFGWYNPYYAGYYDIQVVSKGADYAERTTQTFLEASYVDVRRLERVWSLVVRSKDLQYQDVAGMMSEQVVSRMKKADQL